LTTLANKLLEKEVIFKDDLVQILGIRPFASDVEERERELLEKAAKTKLAKEKAKEDAAAAEVAAAEAAKKESESPKSESKPTEESKPKTEA
jgi:hypothetical protein